VDLLLTGVILAAVAAMAARRWRRAYLRRRARTRSGSSPERAIPVRSYGEMDAHLAGRWCACGGYLERLGEGSRGGDGRRYRVTRLRCQECEAIEEVFFDTTDILH